MKELSFFFVDIQKEPTRLQERQTERGGTSSQRRVSKGEVTEGEE